MLQARGEPTLEEDDQRVSVSESPEGMIGGFKGERALRASAIMVDLRLAQSCIDRVALLNSGDQS